MGIARALDVGTSFAVSALRGGAGLFVGRLGPRPKQPLELYELEGCLYCRLVREALSTLDLDAHIHPCPRGGRRFRPKVRARGGLRMFPFLVDPNSGTEMYEAADIVAYLFERYGAGAVPVTLRGPLALVTGSLATGARPTRGVRARPSRAPTEPLELYSFEASPYCRIAREALCELELPYLLHNVAKRSPRRREFVARSGRMRVPFLVDPNTGTQMFESADIVEYLRATYAA